MTQKKCPEEPCPVAWPIRRRSTQVQERVKGSPQKAQQDDEEEQEALQQDEQEE